jgi:ABC-type lipoprotein release transport system permease subunit
MQGEKAVRWCREQLAEAQRGEQGCEATATGEFLPAGKWDAVVLGSGVAKRLLVTVGDELSVQVAGAGGAPVERRLIVTGIVAAGSPEIAERAAYLQAPTLNALLGTDGPNELVVLLHSISDLEKVRAEVRSTIGTGRGLAVHTWAERNPGLSNLIEMMKAGRIVFFALLAFLAVLSVANATLTSVLERTRQFGVMLALGTRPSALVRLVMLEVALLGLLAVGAGSVVAAGLELFGRIHGWPMAWAGLEPRALEELALSGVVEDTHFFAHLPPLGAALIIGGVYAMFLVTGLWAALKVGRLEVLAALRSR